MEDHIKAYAELALQELRSLSGVDFGYTQEAVKWLEGYILNGSGAQANSKSMT